MSGEKTMKVDKKALRKEMEHLMATSLGKLKEELGEKNFKSRLKKAIKLLTEDVKPAAQIKKEKTTKDKPEKVAKAKKPKAKAEDKDAKPKPTVAPKKSILPSVKDKTKK